MTEFDAPEPPAAQGGRLFAFGLGYCAQEIARRLVARGWRVAGTSRDPARAATDGVERIGFAAGQAFDAQALADATHLLLSIPPDEAGDPALRAAGEAIGRSPSIRWIGYLSTTGVYGDCGGDWVDEDTPPRPTRPRSQRRVAAETAWRALGERTGKAVEVFRLGGIYGPGRSPLDAVRRGEAKRIHLPGRLFGRIHRNDVAAAVLAAIERPVAGRIVNLVDDCPVEPQVVTAYACALLGLPPPPLIPFAEADLTPMGRSFYEDDRRVRNTKLKAELTPDLYAPTFVEGLRDLLDAS